MVQTKTYTQTFTGTRSLKNRSYWRHLENIWVRTAKPIETLFCLFLFPTLVQIYILSSPSNSFIYSLSKSHLVAPELLWFQSCLFTWCLWHNGKHVGEMLKNWNLFGNFKAARGKKQWHFLCYLVVAYCFHPRASYTHKEGGKDKYLQDHRKWKRRTHRTGSYRNIGRNNKRTGGKLVVRVIVATCVCLCVCVLLAIKGKACVKKTVFQTQTHTVQSEITFSQRVENTFQADSTKPRYLNQDYCQDKNATTD